MCRIAIVFLLIGIVSFAHANVVDNEGVRQGKSGRVNLVQWYGTYDAMMDSFVEVGYECIQRKMTSSKAIADFFRDQMGRKYSGTWICSVLASKDDAVFSSYGMSGLGAYVDSKYVFCANCAEGRNCVEPTTRSPPTRSPTTRSPPTRFRVWL